jgi:hypothetical protein
MGAKERRVYWDQEENPKQEGEDDCYLDSREEKQQQQVDYNHKHEDYRSISSPIRESL